MENVYSETSHNCTFSRLSSKDAKQIREVSEGDLVKGPWTPEEDKIVVDMVNKHGARNWSQIAAALRGRVGKQCRERWHNHLKPGIKRAKWTLEEDDIIFREHK